MKVYILHAMYVLKQNKKKLHMYVSSFKAKNVS